MPVIKIKHVVSFSSEDKNHPAENLLKDEQYRKWKTLSNGETSASAVLQFEKASEIHAIDIGNEGSAFVEILVNRSTSKSDFQVLLVASAFMSPAESKSSTNMNRVRMFTAEKLSQTVCKEKFDLVKIVCTQPFNKSIQFGVSFIKFHSPPETNEKPSPALKQQTLGAFNLKTENDTDTITPGSFFAIRKKNSTSLIAGAAAIRDASIKAEENLLQSEKKKPSPDKKSVIPFKANKRANEKCSQDQKDVTTAAPTKRTPTTTLKTNSTTLKRASPYTTPPQISTKKSEEKQRAAPTTKRIKRSSDRECALEEIMSGVVFALSGFQNPYRGELREKGLAMGAKYRPDWDKSCTHLICAFVNTPKFLHVQSEGGKIVSKDWILDCHKQKKKFSWKLYKMSGPSESSESEDDANKASPTRSTASNNDVTNLQKGKKSRSESTSDDRTNDRNQDLNNSVASSTQPLSDDEDMDTDDEISRVNGANQSNEVDSEDAYNADTDVEGDAPPDVCSLPSSSKLPEYFSGLRFFLYGNFNASYRRLLVRYITAYHGELEDYMNERVKFVVTDNKWDKNFDEAVEENSSLVFVKPEWIFACSDKGNVVPHQSHLVTPTGH